MFPNTILTNFYLKNSDQMIQKISYKINPTGVVSVSFSQNLNSWQLLVKNEIKNLFNSIFYAGRAF